MKREDTKDVLVYIEVADGGPVKASLESLTPARSIADARGESVIAAVLGSGREAVANEVARAGADRVIYVDSDELRDFNLDAHADVLGQIVEAEKPAVVLLGGTTDGKDLAPMLAARFQSASASDVIGIATEGKDVTYTMTEYSGTVLSDVKIASAPEIATIRSGAFKKLESPAQGKVESCSYAVSDGAVRAKVIDTVQEITESVNLEDAEIIVSGGRGLGSKEGFALVEELARVLGGEVGATRPAIEDGWIAKNHQVGQSGKCVAPKLYIAAGVSGATQHISGITGADYIVAINRDEDAPIFSVSNVGIIGDALKVLPLMIEEVKKIKES